MYEAFIYKWTNKTNGKYYIGYHKGTPDDGYISSGKTFLTEYNGNPNNFYRQILLYGKKKYCQYIEAKLIMKAIETDGYGMIYNRTRRSTLDSFTCKSYTYNIRCLHCGCHCSTDNDHEITIFESKHFLNCDHHPDNIKKKQKKLNKVKSSPTKIRQNLADNKVKSSPTKIRQNLADNKVKRQHQLSLLKLSTVDLLKYEVVTPAGVFQYLYEAAAHYQISINALKNLIKKNIKFYLQPK